MARPTRYLTVAVLILLAGGAAAFWLVDAGTAAHPPVPAADGDEPTTHQPRRDGNEGASTPDSAKQSDTTGHSEPERSEGPRTPGAEDMDSPSALPVRPEIDALARQLQLDVDRALRAAIAARIQGAADASEEMLRLRERSEAIRKAADVVEFKVTLGGSVITAEGEPASQVSIQVRTRVGDEAAHVPGANLRLMAGLNAGRCDDEGKFRFEFKLSVPRGTEQVEFIVFGRPDTALMSSTIGAAGGPPSGAAECTLRNGATRSDLQLRLPAFAQLKGRVVDAQGHGVARAEVSFIRPAVGGRILGSLTADENGVFIRDEVEPADYSVFAHSNGRRSESMLVRAALGQRMDLPDMVLQPGSVLVVQLGGAGASVSNQLVRLEWFGDRGELLGQTDARTNGDGEVHFAQVPAGRLQFVIRCPRCNPTPQLGIRLVSGETYHYGAIALTAAKK